MSNTKAKMNLPNKLTVLRMMMIPIFLTILLLPIAEPFNILVAGLLFGVAAITDLMDGKIARSRNLVTSFGKFWDPIADKMLVISAMIGLVQCGWMNELYVAATVIVVAREFFVTGVRLMAAGGGKVVAANIWGKLKTVFQMSFIGFAFLREFLNGFSALSGSIGLICLEWLVIVLGAGMIALTLWSAFVYYKQNEEYMQMDR